MCHETFCRSDILKRHFNKCSIRRGNPTGANHLTHAQDHLKGGVQPLPLPSANAAGMAAQNRPSAISTAGPAPSAAYQTQWPTSARSFDGYAGMGQPLPSHNVGGSTRSSRSSSIMRPESSSDDDKKRFSSSSTLHTATGTAETSPSVGTQTFSFGPDRSGMHHQQQHAHQQHQQQHQRDSAFYSAAAGGQHDQLPSMNYLRSGFSQYPAQQQPPQEHMYQQHGWSSAFQPGGSDQLMYSGGH